MPRSTKPQISFADWELLQQGIVLEPLLQNISDFLDDHEELIEPVRRDLQRGLKNPRTGRGGLTPQQVLRSLIVMRVKSWDYRELRSLGVLSGGAFRRKPGKQSRYELRRHSFFSLAKAIILEAAFHHRFRLEQIAAVDH